MTRLIENWIKDIGSTMSEYDKELRRKTGSGLSGIAEKASGVSTGSMAALAKTCKVAVIPVTTGEGIIGSFTDSVAAISRYLGFETIITDSTDVAGIHEAYDKKAQILFLADDSKFIAIDLATGKVAENSVCTARGFIAALEGAAGSLAEKEVLVIGCGEVGYEMLTILQSKSAIPVAFDCNLQLVDRLRGQGFKSIDAPDLIYGYDFILDASSQGGWLTGDMLREGVIIAAPGVPLSLDEEAFRTHQDKLIHDLLPIGVAAMLGALCK